MRNFGHVYFAEILMPNVPQNTRCRNSALRKVFLARSLIHHILLHAMDDTMPGVTKHRTVRTGHTGSAPAPKIGLPFITKPTETHRNQVKPTETLEILTHITNKRQIQNKSCHSLYYSTPTGSRPRSPEVIHRASPAQSSFQDPIPSAYIASTNFAATTVARTDPEHTELASIQVRSKRDTTFQYITQSACDLQYAKFTHCVP